MPAKHVVDRGDLRMRRVMGRRDAPRSRLAGFRGFICAAGGEEALSGEASASPRRFTIERGRTCGPVAADRRRLLRAGAAPEARPERKNGRREGAVVSSCLPPMRPRGLYERRGVSVRERGR